MIASVSAIDTHRLTDLRQIHAGHLYEVFRATFAGRDIAIKQRTASARWETAIASMWHLGSKTSVVFGNQFGWTVAEPAPDESYFEQLLGAEHALIAQCAPYWNHPGAHLVRRRGDDVFWPADFFPPGFGALCLIMPWCNGEPLGSLPRAEQRRLFPAMLPALWRALTMCPHGDLGPTNLMFDRAQGSLHILDPGVRILGPSGRSSQPGLSLSSWLLTTNATHYPLVMPEYGPGWPRLTAPAGGLAGVLEYFVNSNTELFIIHHCGKPPWIDPSPVPAPAVADVIACGAIYFGVLSGTPLLSLLGIDAPLWVGVGSSYRGPAQQREPSIRCLELLAGGAIARALHASGAAPAEIALCERLVMLDLDGAELPRYVADVMHAIA